jgi:hypothetical protein
MTSTIPTYRPRVKPEQSAIAVAVVAVASSLFMTFGGGGSLASPSPRASMDCAEHVATTNWSELWREFAVTALRLQWGGPERARAGSSAGGPAQVSATDSLISTPRPRIADEIRARPPVTGG